jgi:hypothetical protein
MSDIFTIPMQVLMVKVYRPVTARWPHPEDLVDALRTGAQHAFGDTDFMLTGAGTSIESADEVWGRSCRHYPLGCGCDACRAARNQSLNLAERS